PALVLAAALHRRARERAGRPLGLLGREKPRDRPPEHLSGSVPGDGLCARAPALDPALRIEEKDRVVRQIAHDRAQHGLQRLIVFFAVRSVAGPRRPRIVVRDHGESAQPKATPSAFIRSAPYEPLPLQVSSPASAGWALP